MKAMRVYDNMIAEADKQGLRLILPFIDHWWWWGGASSWRRSTTKSGRPVGPIAKTFKAYLDVIRSYHRTNTAGRAYP